MPATRLRLEAVTGVFLMPLSSRPVSSVLTAVLLSWTAAALGQPLAAPVNALPAGKQREPRGMDLSLPEPGPEESFIVQGRRFRLAPSMNYGDRLTPWEAERRHHDVMTGADIAPFGSAYGLAVPLGSDERGNETGGPYAAPRHD